MMAVAAATMFQGRDAELKVHEVGASSSRYATGWAHVEVLRSNLGSCRRSRLC